MPSGRPDWFGTIVAAGKYDSTFIPIAVDEDGSILALMKGAYDTVLKTIKVDSQGRMDARLHTLRHGNAKVKGGSTTAIKDETTSIFTLETEGITYGGEIIVTGEVTNYADRVGLSIDDVEIMNSEIRTMYARGSVLGSPLPLTVMEYDLAEGNYSILINRGMSFDSKVEVTWHNSGDNDVTVDYALRYAEVTL